MCQVQKRIRSIVYKKNSPWWEVQLMLKQYKVVFFYTGRGVLYSTTVIEGNNQILKLNANNESRWQLLGVQIS
jgi:hypothetical protein